MIKYLCNLYFVLTGWKFVNKLPNDVRKFVVVGCPHTSNWDFWLALVFFYRTKIKGRFTIKKQWLKSPFGILFKKLGAIGIDREKISLNGKQSMTDMMADLIIKADDEFVLLITPEGTRKNVHKWKTGFYHVAKKANVPIVLAYGDYSKKELGIGLVIYPTDYHQDMQTIMNFYKKITPKNPELFSIDDQFAQIDWKKRPLVYSCSGRSNVAQMANEIALRLQEEGRAEMSCIAGVGGKVSSIMNVANSDRKVILLDGCPLACAKHCFENSTNMKTLHIDLSREFNIKKETHTRYDEFQLNQIYDLIIKKYF